MVNVGDFVEFHHKSKLVQAQVVGLEATAMEVKILHTDKFVTFENYFKSYATGVLTICRHHSKEIVFISKTIVWDLSSSYERPSWYKRTMAWLRYRKYKRVKPEATLPESGQVFQAYNYKNFSYRWILQAKVQGTLFADGFFIPFPWQAITLPIYLKQYNKLISWKQLNKN